MRITITKDNFLRLYVLMGSTHLKWRKDPDMRFYFFERFCKEFSLDRSNYDNPIRFKEYLYHSHFYSNLP